MSRVSGPSLSLDGFRSIADLAYRESGLALAEEKLTMIQSRLRHRLRSLGVADYETYCTYVSSDAGRKERLHMISALTTNVSHFFREQHHFDLLRDEVVPKALPGLKSGGRLRIWSAGCSRGQEALSAAMTLLEAEPELANLDVRILATDIDRDIIRFADAGIYAPRMVTAIPEPLRAKYFEEAIEQGETCFASRPILRRMVQFKPLNLLAAWPLKGQVDVIFCRNVVIYFDLAVQNALWPRFYDVLAPGGLLCVGHSERIADPAGSGFISTGASTYQSAA
jgi:chemotaxis protein methyltransferase CheR